MAKFKLKEQVWYKGKRYKAGVILELTTEEYEKYFKGKGLAKEETTPPPLKEGELHYMQKELIPDGKPLDELLIEKKKNKIKGVN